MKHPRRGTYGERHDSSMMNLTPANTFTVLPDSIQSSLYYKADDDDDDDTVNKKDIREVIVEKENLVSKKQSRVVSRSTPNKNIVTLETLDDFIDYMYLNKEKVVVVRFFASWCKVRDTRVSFHFDIS